MGKIDQITNEYMKDKSRFSDVFNYFMYGGRQVLHPEHLHDAPSDCCRICDSTYLIKRIH